jgi:hypothetical protein
MNVQDMSRDELKDLIREVFEEFLQEVTSEPTDPDNGLNFRPEIADRLRRFLREEPSGLPASEVARDLDYDV